MMKSKRSSITFGKERGIRSGFQYVILPVYPKMQQCYPFSFADRQQIPMHPPFTSHIPKLVLASASPRRRHLLQELGLPFMVEARHAEELYPAELQRQEIPLHLAALKSAAFADEELEDGRIVLTADTIVWVNGHVLNKPEDEEDAKRMLHILSGNMHEVYTGIQLRSNRHTVLGLGPDRGLVP
jgi:hypothetical protein